jgi:preprotein translocase subunit SecG
MLYLIIAITVMVVGISFVLLRNRKPSSMGHSIGEFEKGLDALRPEDERHGA